MQKKRNPIIFENIAHYTCAFAFFVVPLQRKPKVCRHINIALLLFRVQEKSLRN